MLSKTKMRMCDNYQRWNGKMGWWNDTCMYTFIIIQVDNDGYLNN